MAAHFLLSPLCRTLRACEFLSGWVTNLLHRRWCRVIWHNMECVRIPDW
jgi:hypothetical protein